MLRSTLLFVVDVPRSRLLLALKKRGLGHGKLNGSGGKMGADDASIEAAAVRETEEVTFLAAAITPRLIGERRKRACAFR